MEGYNQNLNIAAKENQGRGFTLVELLIVIAIIGLLSAIVLVSLRSASEKAKIARAQQELSGLHKAISVNFQLSGGTSPSPTNTAIGTDCSYWGPGTVVGIVNNAGGYYDDWMGPWMAQVPKDPWGNCYALDGPVDEGCPGSLYGAKICSAGPNGSFESWNGTPVSREDDICMAFMCP